MTLTQLRYLIALADYRHFARAAEAVGVSQPTLSTQVQRLEHHLGVSLFQRHKKPIQPTDVGHAVIAQARVVLRESRNLEDLVTSDLQTVQGELTLGIIPTLAPYLLPRVLTDFTRRYPDIRLTIKERLTSDVLDELHHDDLDAALVSNHDAQRGLSSQVIFRESFAAFVHPEHRLSPRATIASEDLDLDDLWLLSDGHCFRDQVVEICREARHRSDSYALVFESGNLETLVRLVKSSGGMTLLPQLAVLELSEDDRGRYVRGLEPTPYRDIRLLTRQSAYKRALIEAFATTVLDVLPDGEGLVCSPDTDAV